MRRSPAASSIPLAVCAAFAASASASSDGFPTVYHSPPLDHAIPRDIGGVTLNLVTCTLDDTGPLSGDWDINFWADGNVARLAFDPLDTYEVGIVVDADGYAAVLQPGDIVGAASTFATTVDAAPLWLAGTDGYLGVVFDCAGRVSDPGPAGICFGYVHITSGANHGFPATIVDYAFDVAGRDIVVDEADPFASCYVGDTIFCNGLEPFGVP